MSGIGREHSWMTGMVGRRSWMTGMVGRPSRIFGSGQRPTQMSGSGWETLSDVQELSRGKSWMSGSCREAIPGVQEW